MHMAPAPRVQQPVMARPHAHAVKPRKSVKMAAQATKGPANATQANRPAAPAAAAHDPAAGGESPAHLGAMMAMSHGLGLSPLGGLAAYSMLRAHHSHYWPRYRHYYPWYNNAYARNRLLRLQRLIADLNYLSPGATVSSAQRNVFHRDLMAVAQGPARPMSQPVHQLSNGLVTALPQRTRPLLNTRQLAFDLETVMNRSHLPPAQVTQAIGSAEAILKQSGINPTTLQSLVSQMRLVGLGQTP
jgi:hypothetical protein